MNLEKRHQYSLKTAWASFLSPSEGWKSINNLPADINVYNGIFKKWCQKLGGI